tara:strand:+ start:152 stop:304 length:153 start_codon:yes stop_codon:yes gene_type:complete
MFIGGKMENTTKIKILDKKVNLHSILTEVDETEIFDYVEFPYDKPVLEAA